MLVRTQKRFYFFKFNKVELWLLGGRSRVERSFRHVCRRTSVWRNRKLLYSAFDLVSLKGIFGYLEKFCFLLRLHSVITSFHEDRPNKAHPQCSWGQHHLLERRIRHHGRISCCTYGQTEQERLKNRTWSWNAFTSTPVTNHGEAL